MGRGGGRHRVASSPPKSKARRSGSTDLSNHPSHTWDAELRGGSPCVNRNGGCLPNAQAGGAPHRVRPAAHERPQRVMCVLACAGVCRQYVCEQQPSRGQGGRAGFPRTKPVNQAFHHTLGPPCPRVLRRRLVSSVRGAGAGPRCALTLAICIRSGSVLGSGPRGRCWWRPLRGPVHGYT